MTEPTPRPWRTNGMISIYGELAGGIGESIGSCSGVVSFHRGRANAAHIVKCVNMHDEAIALLHRIIEDAERYDGFTSRTEELINDWLKRAEETND